MNKKLFFVSAIIISVFFIAQLTFAYSNPSRSGLAAVIGNFLDRYTIVPTVAPVTAPPLGGLLNFLRARTTPRSSLLRAPLATPSADEVAVSYQYIVRLKPSVSPENLLLDFPAEIEILAPSLNLFLFTVPSVMSLSTIEEFLGDQVEYVERNRIDWYLDVTPNDPLFNTLWGMHNIGQDGGANDADIDAPEAWDIKSGSDFVVGIIDSGIDYNHPDLAPNVWVNPGEVFGNNRDDDNNGYIDDVHGWDFINNDNDPMDGYSHGTHVAGTIGAVGNNGVGVVGVNWAVKMAALKIFSDGGGTTTDAIIRAIDYANKMGFKVTSNSWGGGGYSQALYDVIKAAGDKGYLFIAAAGNRNSNNDSFAHYPSSYDLNNIVAVAASDQSDNRAGFSSYGKTTVDLAAPGVSTNSTIPNGGYGMKSGTSMATPHVSGAAALFWAKNLGVTAAEVEDALMKSVDKLPVWETLVVSGGRLNLNNLLKLGGGGGGGGGGLPTVAIIAQPPLTGRQGNDKDLIANVRFTAGNKDIYPQVLTLNFKGKSLTGVKNFDVTLLGVGKRDCKVQNLSCSVIFDPKAFGTNKVRPPNKDAQKAKIPAGQTKTYDLQINSKKFALLPNGARLDVSITAAEWDDGVSAHGSVSPMPIKMSPLYYGGSPVELKISADDGGQREVSPGATNVRIASFNVSASALIQPVIISKIILDKDQNPDVDLKNLYVKLKGVQYGQTLLAVGDGETAINFEEMVVVSLPVTMEVFADVLATSRPGIYPSVIDVVGGEARLKDGDDVIWPASVDGQPIEIVTPLTIGRNSTMPDPQNYSLGEKGYKIASFSLKANFEPIYVSAMTLDKDLNGNIDLQNLNLYFNGQPYGLNKAIIGDEEAAMTFYDSNGKGSLSAPIIPAGEKAIVDVYANILSSSILGANKTVIDMIDGAAYGANWIPWPKTPVDGQSIILVSSSAATSGLSLTASALGSTTGRIRQVIDNIARIDFIAGVNGEVTIKSLKFTFEGLAVPVNKMFWVRLIDPVTGTNWKASNVVGCQVGSIRTCVVIFDFFGNGYPVITRETTKSIYLRVDSSLFDNVFGSSDSLQVQFKSAADVVWNDGATDRNLDPRLIPFQVAAMSYE